MTLDQLVGRNIARLRKKKMSQPELGRKIKPYLGVEWSRQTVWTLESGNRSASVTELVAIGQVLDAPLSAFFEAEQPDEKFAFQKDRAYPSVDGRTLVAGFMTKETQERLGTLYELGAVREYAAGVQAIVRELRARRDQDLGDFDEIDTLAGLWDQPKKRKPPRKRRKAGKK